MALLSIPTLIWLSLQPSLRVFVLIIFGALLTFKGLISQSGRRAITVVNFYLIFPCNIAYYIAKTLSIETMKQWWALAVNSLLSVAVGVLLASIAVRVFRVPCSFRPQYLLLVGLSNVGSIPLVLLPALARESPAVFGEESIDLALPYAVVSNWFWVMVVIPMIQLMVKPPKPVEPLSVHVEGGAPASEMSRVVLEKVSAAKDSVVEMRDFDMSDTSKIGANNGSQSSMKSREDEEGSAGEGGQDYQGLEGKDGTPQLGWQFVRSIQENTLYQDPSVPVPLSVIVSEDVDQSNMDVTADTVVARTQEESNVSSQSEQEEGAPIKTQLLQRWRKVSLLWKSTHKFRDTYIPPATIAAILATIVGVSPALQDILFGSDAPLQFFSDSVLFLAQAVVPAFLLPVGATLALGPGKSSLSGWVIFSVVVLKLVAVPLVGSSIVYGAWKLGWVPAPDRLFLIQLLAVHALPSSNLVHNVCTTRGVMESEVGVVLFWQYVGSIVTLPVAMFIYLTLVEDI